ncbi:DUF1990 family protein [Kutzneria buriramensis]|uniref:Uncharacterized protein (UPF0548 family) n=1 Tax=Kutzneria buriramensis TaxID=1045776 RepID=A0A3E0I9F9_9PSEU|nr:DUF1990 domain-containing protein [Kutzneria buriramensis]REH55368.1 uncharacterized protein (UPF0548 family) [Kutzneria buriramensis]
MTVELLDPAKAASLQAAPLTYAEVGATVGAMPAGYHAISRRVRLRTGFEEAAEKLFAWRAQEASGLRVQASSKTVEPKAVVVLRLGPIQVPCRVVYVVDQQNRKGFAYGTLPGHPESGEEAFIVERNADGTASFTVTAFSKPATLLARLGGPFPRMAQNLVTDRYLRAL